MQKKSYPLTGSVKTVETLSVIITALMAASSLAALLLPNTLYTSEETRQGMLTNDLVNLVIGVPAIIACLVLHRCRNLIGLLFWPGALFYVTYNSLAATVAFPSWPLFLAHLALTVCSVAALVLLVPHINMPAVRQRLESNVRERFSGSILAFGGFAFFLLALNLLFAGEGTRAEVSTAIADLIIAPTWFITGAQLFRRKPFGYTLGGGMLFHAAILFVGLLIYFLLQPIVAGVPFPLEDFIAIAPMAVVFFIPFELFLRGIVKGKK